jgi:hypothetical protein
MRDLWYELCETRFPDSPSIQLNKEIDDMKARQLEHGALLSGIQDLLGKFYTAQTSQIASATTASQVMSVSGVYVPEFDREAAKQPYRTNDPGKKHGAKDLSRMGKWVPRR